MTPTLYGMTAFLITLGVLAPIIITLVIRALYEIVKEVIQQRKRDYRRYMNPQYWFVRKVVQAPNPDYIQIHMENSESGEIICHGIDKKHLRSLEL